MQTEHALLLRAFFILLFAGVLLSGFLVMKNFEKLFGVDPDVPSETSSGRSYGKVQVLAVWLHALVLTGVFALLF